MIQTIKLMLLGVITLSVMSACSAKNYEEYIPEIFGDNMVLQRNTNVTFWGYSAPGTEVLVKCDWGEEVNTKVDANGKWSVDVPTTKAGGPYNVAIKVGKFSKILRNVMLGEVWLCSGQSNMEMPLQGWPPRDMVLNAKKEIKNSANNNLRMFTKQKQYSAEPSINCKGSWQVSSPENASGFSATAYFFGKKLQEELGVPVGLIHSSWGGTPVKAWTSQAELEKVSNYQHIVADLKASVQQMKDYNTWLEKHKKLEISATEDFWKNLDLVSDKVVSIEYNDSYWPEMNLPQLWEKSELGQFDGVVWFRKVVEIPDNLIGKKLTLNLGPIDDMDKTYVNGKLVGSHEKFGKYYVPRVYDIPAELVTENKLTIAVRVIDYGNGGGIWNSRDFPMHIAEADGEASISIAGTWKFMPVAEFIIAGGQYLYVFDIDEPDYPEAPKVKIKYDEHAPSALYNGMINPLIPFTIKGAIWYQGESDTGEPEKYTELFRHMIEGWREDFNVGDFPFYYTQIAPYNYGVSINSAYVREAQLKSLSIPNTGMAVTLDIGDTKLIHPANKQDVGARLALWALNKDYGKDVAYSGPVYKNYEVTNKGIKIFFEYGNDMKLVKQEGKTNFTIAGSDKNFVDASVKIYDDYILVYSSKVKKPEAVRYTWDNISAATLFNGAELPASTFRTDSW